MVDLFSGCGAMTLGADEACRALHLELDPVLAVDINEKALAVYAHNYPRATTLAESVTSLVDSPVGSALSSAERRLARQVGDVDLVIGGPPCQGNSDLNNHTRRADPKNNLYFTMARFAEVVRPRHLLIENVPGVVHDRGGVVRKTREALEGLGYAVSTHVMEASTVGAAQRRRRFFLVASTRHLHDDEIAACSGTRERPLSWAIGDLVDAQPGGNETFDTSAEHSARNQERIAYLFAHDLHELPNTERPPCHRDKVHSYNSVYGRMFWDRAAPTITTGFGSTGQGRYVHPLRPRTMTPHEAARVQFIPDFYEFPERGRRALQEMIGNAVPPKLSFAVVLALLSH
jgi:DNA (cytosine-5)-methyltransferase 1